VQQELCYKFSVCEWLISLVAQVSLSLRVELFPKFHIYLDQQLGFAFIGLLLSLAITSASDYIGQEYLTELHK
jgi:hypothetical protein